MLWGEYRILLGLYDRSAAERGWDHPVLKAGPGVEAAEDGKHWADGKAFVVQGMTDDFHTYGVMVTADDIVFYFDGVELRRIDTPEEAKVPLYMLVNLALGGGWPIDKTPNPSYMYVDYVKAYAK